MPRFYFHLTSKENNIPDDSGKELDTLTDAYEHPRALIDKILFHVGHDDAEVRKVVISNDEDDAQMIVPFAVSHAGWQSKGSYQLGDLLHGRPFRVWIAKRIE